MFRSGQSIGPYILITRIGRGGFGEVWLAERRTKFVTTKVAVKLPLEEQINAESIKSEAVLWEQASGHPNVLPLIDADEYDGQIVIVSEYAPDGSLEELLHKSHALPIKRSIELTIGILNGLEFLHSRKILHRDIKPANILLQSDIPRLTDFGISRVMKTTSISMNASGTPAYMAPEAFDRQRTVQTDIWSVGVVLYQMLTGHLPFPHDDLTNLFAAIIRDEPEPFPSFVPGDLQQAVLRALTKDPATRYQSSSQMRTDLSHVLISISQQTNLPTWESDQWPTVPEDELRLTGMEGPPNIIGRFPPATDHKVNLTRPSDTTQQLEKDLVLTNTSDIPKAIIKNKRPLVTVGLAIMLLAFPAGYFFLKPWASASLTQRLVAASLIPYKKGELFGFCDADKKFVIEPKYDFVRPFSEGLAAFSAGWHKQFQNERLVTFTQGKWGVVDKTGNEIVPPKYDYIGDFADGIAIVNIGLEYNKKGNAIASGKYGLIDRSGNEIVPPKYDHISEFHEGLAAVELNNRTGFIDKIGDIVIPPTYGRAEDFHSHLAMVSTASYYRGIIEGVPDRSEGKPGKAGFIDMSGKEVIPQKFDRADSFSEGLASVVIKEKCGYIDRSGKIVIAIKYSGCKTFTEGLAGVQIGNEWGFVDKNGNEVIPAKFDSVSKFSEGMALVNVGWEMQASPVAGFTGKWGFIDKSGATVVPIGYDLAEEFEEGRAVVNKGRDISTDSTEIKDGDSFKLRNFLVSRGKYGYIDKSGKEVIPLKYSFADAFKNGFAEVVLDDNSFYIDENGTEYLEP
jgi:serine/threonine protein kinase